VLVLLDSHHAAAHVLTEMEAYCPLVSVGSFCIVEDTKLSRWTNSDPGPLASVQSFLAWHAEFAVDRDRELLFTHHPYGYLQRLY
jgi:cephalosporin hydroxylase